MAGRIVLGIGNPSLDSNGAVMNGALFYYYRNGTTTLQDIYGTAANADAGTNPLANPVVADSAGRTPDIWCADDSVYSVLWTSATAATIRTFDDIRGITVPAEDQIGEPGVYYLSQQAGVLDGTDVDVPALNGAIQTIAVTPGILKLPPDTLAMSAKSLVLKHKVPIHGQSMDLTELDFSSDTTWASATGMITATGTGPGTWCAITAAILKGATAITNVGGTLTPFAELTHIMLRSDEFARPHINDVLKFTWTAGAPIDKGALTWANSNWYICTTAGTTGATAPTSIVNPVADNTAVLYYIDYANSHLQQRWAASTVVALGDIRVTPTGLILICCTAGTTGTVTPAPVQSNSIISLVTDNTAVWRYAGYYNATKGELKPYGVQRVSGTTIYLNEPIEDDYPQSYSGVNFTVEIAPVDLAEIELADLTIRGSGYDPAALTPVGSGTAQYNTSSQLFDIGLQARWCFLTLRRVRFIGVEQFGWHRQCAIVSTEGCEYIHSPIHIESQQYGGFAQGAGDVLEANPLCVNSRHLNDGDGSSSIASDYLRGVPGNITINGSKARGCWQSVAGNHRDARRLVVTDFDWTVLTAGFKPRCPDYVLDGGIIVGPKYATEAEYIAQEALVTGYYQASDGYVDNVRLEGGHGGVRLSNADGEIANVWIRADIKDALTYGVRLGAFAGDEMRNCYIDVAVSGTVLYDNILIDGPLDNSEIRLKYDGGRAGITNSNSKPTITETDIHVRGEGCTGAPIDLYNWTNGTLGGGTRKSTYNGVLHRLKDCNWITVESATTVCPTGFTDSAWKFEATALSSATHIVMLPQTVSSPSSTGTAVEVSLNVSSSDFHAINTTCATKITAGANATNRYAGAPNNLQDGAYTFVLQDMATAGFDRLTSHTSGSAHAWTLNAGVFPVAAKVPFGNDGSGVVTLTRGAGVVIRLAGADANRAVAQYGGGVLIQTATDHWIVSGGVLVT